MSRDWAEAARSNHVVCHTRRARAVGEWRVRQRIDWIAQRRGQRREIARSLHVGRHDRLTRSGLGSIPQPLIRSEPEQFVLDNRSTRARAGLILLLLGLSRAQALQKI